MKTYSQQECVKAEEVNVLASIEPVTVELNHMDMQLDLVMADQQEQEFSPRKKRQCFSNDEALSLFEVLRMEGHSLDKINPEDELDVIS